jgi:hypothetical protein
VKAGGETQIEIYPKRVESNRSEMVMQPRCG